MIIVYIAFGIFLVLFLILGIFIPKFKRKVVFQKISDCANNRYKTVESKKYDIILDTDKDIYNKDIIIKIILIDKGSEVCINSKETIKVSYGKNPEKPGAGYKYHKYLKECIPFLKEEVDEVKLLIVYQKPDKIIRHINESELAFVSFKDSPYGYRVCEFDDACKCINHILKEIKK